MKIGTGVDLIEIRRIKEAINRWNDRFLDKVFTPREIEYSKGKRFYFENLAARFAAKEAVFKAIGNLNLRWQDIEILNNGEGKPVVRLNSRARALAKKEKITEINISLTHSRDYAVAQAIILRGLVK
ncbi:MAG: holo-ACP synthase [Candidatus Omnitrophica bacterium]|nr:holo-ACP synthase [Candidatus Omnitrophota bacterium]